ncbi:MAG TPA: hydrolase 1, exosortase A system-associated [Croceibacterium sp.]|nr:hydrolase 1, exosortase A system-associated [Croceibacterium sp.]
MSRRHLTFGCGLDTLVGTLDDAPGATGLLLVSGGSEIRSGAFSGQAQLAARLAARGHPVLRYDRRGIGDSSGADAGFRNSAPDIAAALAAFRREAPHVARVVAFGNCDAASALMLAEGAGCDGLVLANPWTFDSDDNAAPPPAAIRARYMAKLRNPRELLRLLTGKVSLTKLVGGLAQSAKRSAPTNLAGEIGQGLARFTGPVRILIAGRDRTGQAFLAAWKAGDARIRRCEGANHAFAEADAREWLLAQLLDALSE